MGKQENRKTSGRRLDWFVVLMVGIVGYFSYMMVSQHFYLNSVNQDYDAAQQRLQSAQQENDALQQEKAQLNDPAYIEKIAREELGMTRQGEMPYIYSRK
jgi:cell division protein DivIC